MQKLFICLANSRKFVLSLILTLLMLTISQQVEAQDQLSQFIGKWKGTGKLFGNTAYFDMTWEKSLGDNFIHLDFQNVAMGKDGSENVFSAEAFYQVSQESGKYSGAWYDSRGKILQLTSELKENVLTVLWSDPGIEEGKTEYKLIDANQIEAIDYVMKDNEWTSFAQATYKKVETKKIDKSIIGVTGIGGVFFRSENRKDVLAWYRKNLGIDSEPYGKSFLWKEYDDSSQTGYTVWGPFGKETEYFGNKEQKYMINYRVANMESLLENLKAAGVEIVGEMQEFPNGKFAWIKDLEGIRVELWEPIDSNEDPYLK